MQIFTKSGLISPKILHRCILNAKMFQKWRGHLRHLWKQLEKAKKADAGSDENEITGYIHSVLFKILRRVTKPHTTNFYMVWQAYLWQ